MQYLDVRPGVTRPGGIFPDFINGRGGYEDTLLPAYKTIGEGRY